MIPKNANYHAEVWASDRLFIVILKIQSIKNGHDANGNAILVSTVKVVFSNATLPENYAPSWAEREMRVDEPEAEDGLFSDLSRAVHWVIRRMFDDD